MNNRHQSVVMINDHQLVSELLEYRLKQFGFGKIETYTDIESALGRILSDPPELVVIDMMLPVAHTSNGERADIADPYILMDSQIAFRAMRKIRDACPKTKILMITGERHPNSFILGFEAGTHGIASKLDSLQECLKILKSIMSGKTQVTSPRMCKLIEEYNQSPVPSLSSFEVQILELVQEGLESPEIGKKLGYSAKTIRNTVSRINEKLGTSNRYKAMQKAVDMGLVGWRTSHDGN